MPVRTHTNDLVHGKRVRVWFEAKDDSPEAVKAMFEEVAAYRQKQKLDRAARVTKQSFRKVKVSKNA